MDARHTLPDAQRVILALILAVGLAAARPLDVSAGSRNLAPLNGNDVSSRGVLTVPSTMVADATPESLMQPDSCQGSLTAASSHNLTTNRRAIGLPASFSQVSAVDLGLIWDGSAQRIGPGSVALDVGDGTAGTATDQRGWSRPKGGDGDGTATCDIGAFEYVPGSRLLYVPAILRR